MSSPDSDALGVMKTVGMGCRMRLKGPKIEAEGRERGGVLGGGQQAPPARGSGSDVKRPNSYDQDQDRKNKTKTTGSKQRHLADLTFR